MRYLQQKSYADVGKQIGRTAHQARALCHKAIGRLRQRMVAPDTAQTEEQQHETTFRTRDRS